MLHLPNGSRIEGDEEVVYRRVDLEQAGGDGLYEADLVEATGLSGQRVALALAGLVDAEVLQAVATPGSDDLGPRYVTGRAG